MLCPVFPDVLLNDKLGQLVDAIRPDRLETIWAEPYNDRQNWRQVIAGYPEGSPAYDWMLQMFQDKDWDLWSQYATSLYVQLRDKAEAEGWLDKLKYLLYEDHISAKDSVQFTGLKGVLLQSKAGGDGFSQNPAIAKLQ